MALPLRSPWQWLVVCGIQNHALEDPVGSDSCVLGQDSGIPGFLGHNTLSGMQSQALCLGQSLDHFQYFSLFFT